MAFNGTSTMVLNYRKKKNYFVKTLDWKEHEVLSKGRDMSISKEK